MVPMKPATRRTIQKYLLIVLALVTVRTAWILYRRSAPLPARPAPHIYVNPDYYVYPPHAYLTDFASAGKLVGTVVWVREGYRYPAYPYDPGFRRTQHGGDADLLPPLRQITIGDVTREPGKKPGIEEVNLVFQDEKASPPFRSVNIGVCERRHGCRFYFDEMFFLKDPRLLYSHWDAETWKAIERHEIREGMTEAQINFAAGYGRVISDGRGIPGAERVVEFRPPGRPPVIVTFDSRGYARFIQTISERERMERASALFAPRRNPRHSA
jgi:hypothetical protein